MTSRRRRPIKREQGKLRDARLLLIVSEGSDPEQSYFEFFDTSPRRQFLFIGPENNRSAPVHLGDRLSRAKRDLDWQPDDVCAIVLDKDRWPDKALRRLAREAIDHDAILALSHPCFEYWVMLHFGDAASIPVERRKLKSVVGRKKAEVGTQAFSATVVRNVHEAIRRAIDLDTDPDNRWPEQPGSRVYRLMKRVLASPNRQGNRA